MTFHPISMAVLAVILLVSPAALAGDHDAHHTPAHHTASAELSPAENELNNAMAQMHEAMNVPATGNADADFVRGMIPHHQGAVAMAQIVLKYGKDPEIQKLARDIINAQNTEIAMMRQWLKDKDIPERGSVDLR